MKFPYLFAEFKKDDSGDKPNPQEKQGQKNPAAQQPQEKQSQKNPPAQQGN